MYLLMILLVKLVRLILPCFPNGTIANWTNLIGNYNDSARVNFSGTNLVDGQYELM